MTNQKLLEHIMETHPIFIDNEGVVWLPTLEYADGKCVLIMVCKPDKGNEFLHYCDMDEMEWTCRSFIIKGTDGYGKNETMRGKFYSDTKSLVSKYINEHNKV